MSSAFSFPILHEDNHVIVIEKKAGMLSQGDLSGDLDVLTVVKQFIKMRDKKPGNVYLGLVHRLDRPVGGAMILAKTSKAASRLSLQFRQRDTKKVYRAVVAGVPSPQEADLCHQLLKDSQTRITRVVKTGGKEARMSYRVIPSAGKSAGKKSHIEIALHTGLPHQIRVQLSTIGCPIVGDKKYGSKEYLPGGPGTIALYSHSIGFLHPTTKELIQVTANPPNWWK